MEAIRPFPNQHDGERLTMRFLTAMLMVFWLSAVTFGTSEPQANSAQESASTSQPDDVRVWVNTNSGVYHCPGARWYGNTKNGEYMTEKQAKHDGYRAASGKVCRTLDQTQRPVADSTSLPQTVPVVQCGFERWPVKVLRDKDTNQVEWKPIETTIAKLTRLPKPDVQYQYDHRIASEERHVYKVRAKLLQVLTEQDSDLHLLLADSADDQSRMIAEVPAPECAVGTGHEEEYRSARDAIGKLTLGSMIEVTGMGFFDYLHDQSGAAQNGIELHPVLRVRLLQSSPNTARENTGLVH